jgi:hypothetical protein
MYTLAGFAGSTRTVATRPESKTVVVAAVPLRQRALRARVSPQGDVVGVGEGRRSRRAVAPTSRTLART